MKIHLKPPQGSVFLCEKRFRVLVAGRRFGKTFLALVELCRAASIPGSLVWYVGPTIKQAKRIAWKALKKMTQPYWKGKPNETDLRLELIWGGTICVCGADNFDALRGDGLDFLVLDEFASMAPAAWTEVLRPALADKQGRALFIGTPHGHNHFYDLYEAAQERPDWATFQYTTEQGGNVPREELESATHEMDERTYRQEFCARFENLGVGRAYYAFEREHNVRHLRYNPEAPLFWALDFNIDPLCSVLGQIVNGRVYILDELILPDSNTLAACEEFLERTRKWTVPPELPVLPDDADEQAEQLMDDLARQLQPRPLNVYVYGDATGTQMRTSASRTDWQIIKNFFGRYTDRYHAGVRVPSANPPVKDRINCVNAMLHNYAGDRRLLIDPRCKHLIRDLEQVSWKADPHGNPLTELDKSDPMRTHVSDALGYCLSREFPMRRQNGEQPGRAIV
jgi:hypothetical protein